MELRHGKDWKNSTYQRMGRGPFFQLRAGGGRIQWKGSKDRWACSWCQCKINLAANVSISREPRQSKAAPKICCTKEKLNLQRKRRRKYG
jgi:hypothetical protein